MTLDKIAIEVSRVSLLQLLDTAEVAFKASEDGKEGEYSPEGLERARARLADIRFRALKASTVKEMLSLSDELDPTVMYEMIHPGKTIVNGRVASRH